MPKIEYKSINFRPRSSQMIFVCNQIIAEFSSQGFDLTLRQLYYQLVSQGIIPNSQKEYDKLGSLINDARLAGLVDWDAIVDRTRELRINNHWDSPDQIVRAVSEQYRVDLWEGQPTRVEVWIEKDALVGVIDGVCRELDCPFFSCRGYTSQSEMWTAGQRIINRYNDEEEQQTVILHLGDHDPSGIDMSRDIADRLELFCDHDGVPAPDIRRIALNMNQVRQYNPPENPAKLTDSRVGEYIRKHGKSSWELDALRPQVIVDLVRRNIMEIMEDPKKFKARLAEQKDCRSLLGKAADSWTQIVEKINEGEL